MDSIKRSYHPGSEWIYYKLYTGPKTADALLSDLIKPIAENLIQDKAIQKWFFIRYQDPKFHLRVRFKVTNTNTIGNVINELGRQTQSYIEEGLIWKMQLDTYQREIERYGLETIDDSETLFFNDSEMITNFLDLIDDSNEGEELRWLFSLRAIDTFLNDFGLNEEQKLYVVEQLKISFCNEFNMNRFLKKQLDKKYLDYQKNIEQFIAIDKSESHDFSSLIRCISIKSEQSVSAIERIKKDVDPEAYTSYLASHIHMTMNRLFRSKNRLYEMVIYYFLFKHYKTTIGRKRHSIQIAI